MAAKPGIKRTGGNRFAASVHDSPARRGRRTCRVYGPNRAGRAGSHVGRDRGSSAETFEFRIQLNRQEGYGLKGTGESADEP
jgi:hypothetical protein